MVTELDEARRACAAFESAASQSQNARIELGIALDALEALASYVNVLEKS